MKHINLLVATLTLATLTGPFAAEAATAVRMGGGKRLPIFCSIAPDSDNVVDGLAEPMVSPARTPLAAQAGRISTTTSVSPTLVDGAGATVADEHREITLFDAAVTYCNVELVKDLLEHGANPNQLTRDSSILHWVASNKRLAYIKGDQSREILRLLLAHGANPNTKRPGISGAIHWAASQGLDQVIELLLNAQPSLANVFGGDDMTPAMWAAQNGHLRVLQVLHRFEADFRKRNSHRKAAIDYVTRHSPATYNFLHKHMHERR